MTKEQRFEFRYGPIKEKHEHWLEDHEEHVDYYGELYINTVKKIIKKIDDCKNGVTKNVRFTEWEKQVIREVFNGVQDEWLDREDLRYFIKLGIFW